MARILVQLPGGEGFILGADGRPELTHDVMSERGQPLQPWDRFQTLRLGLSGDRMLFGGLLPDGAVSVEAVEATGVRKTAAVGAGTWAVVFEDGAHGDPAVGFRDVAGAFVHRPMPALYPHHPVDDAEEPCPVCDSVQYEVYFPTEDWRAGRGRKGTDDYQPSPLVVCRVCGHQETAGGIFQYRREDSDEDEATRAARLARVRAEQMVQRWYADKMTLLGLSFAVYAAEGWPARISGSGSHGDDVASLTIAHARPLPDSVVIARPRLEITTSVDPHEPEPLTIARDTFGSRIASGGREEAVTDGLSKAALTLWFRAHRRRRAAASFAAAVSETEITIEGRREPFLTVGSLEAQWVAVRRHHGATVTVVAREIDPAALELEPLSDPAGRLLGPQPEEP